MNFSYKKRIVILFFALISVVVLFVAGKKFNQKDYFQKHNSETEKTKDVISGEGHLSQEFSDDSLEYTDPALFSHKSAFSEYLYTDNPDEPIKTNQWFSSLYFSDTSEVLFIYPLALKFTKKGFQVGYPDIQKTPDTIFGSFSDDIAIEFQEPVSVFVSQTSDLSVQVVLRSDTNKSDVAKVTITRGSPLVFLETLNDTQKIVINSKKSIQNSNNEYYLSEVAMQAKLCLFFEDGKFELSHQSESNQITAESFRKNSLFTIGIVSKDGDGGKLKDYAFDPIEKTQVNFAVQGDRYKNSFSYSTLKNKETILALFPWQRQSFDEENGIGNKLETIRGNMEFYRGNKAEFFVPRIVPNEQLSVSDFPQQRKQKLKELIIEDVKNFQGFKATDTYFHGKELLKMAQIYDLAMQLELIEEAEVLGKAIRVDLEKWKLQSLDLERVYSNQYFSFDPKIKGIVGYEPSFGSDQFNDHHFHYGYFIHTAAILAKHDKSYIEKNQKFINVLVKDFINHERRDKNFAFLRNFDLFEGHSWAGGTAQFGDGNNQESSSEAVHAYYGAYLWSKQIGNGDFGEVSLWLYNNEIDSAKRHWFVFDDKSFLYESYGHSLVSLLWGGKIEWATWFSSEPEAKLGIQLLPMHAGSEYLSFDQSEAAAYLAETDFPEKGLFFDYLVMFSAFNDAHLAEELFGNIEDEDIDGGNSRSFIYAWISNQLVNENK